MANKGSSVESSRPAGGTLVTVSSVAKLREPSPADLRSRGARAVEPSPGCLPRGDNRAGSCLHRNFSPSTCGQPVVPPGRLPPAPLVRRRRPQRAIACTAQDVGGRRREIFYLTPPACFDTLRCVQTNTGPIVLRDRVYRERGGGRNAQNLGQPFFEQNTTKKAHSRVPSTLALDA